MSWPSNDTKKHDTKHIQTPALTTTLTPTLSTPSAQASAKATSKATAIHISTSRLTQTIHLHTFYLSPASSLRWTPSQHIELQLPPDLDLIGGRAALDDKRRRLELTPCRYSRISDGCSDIGDNDHANIDAPDVGAVSNGTVEVQFVTRTGTLTSQIGLPRFRALEVSVLGCGGGFPDGAHGSAGGGNLDGDGATRVGPVAVAVAGGVGICAFLATAAGANGDALQCRPEDKENQEGEENMKLSMLFWTLHVDDWEFVHYAIERGLLVVDTWSRIHVFMTSGTETIAPGRAERRAEAIRELLSTDERLVFYFRRMQVDDLTKAIDSKTTVAPCDSGMAQGKTSPTSTILFCGGKALEWQIKLWVRSMSPSPAVYTTKMQK